MTWFVTALKKYAVFSGRSRRKEYWYFILFYVIICIVLGFIEGSISAQGTSSGGILTSIFVLAMLVPSITVGVRRLHDTDRSGWWMLLTFVPLIGTIVLLVFTVQDSQPGSNRFGPNPKTDEAVAVT